MKLVWQVDPDDIKRVREFFDLHRDNALVQTRIAMNLADDKPPVTKAIFWEVVIACLLTTQQRSGPDSAVTKFISIDPCPLSHDLCQAQPDLEELMTKVLSEFGGLRRFNTISRQAKANWNYLEGGGWAVTLEVLESIRKSSTPKSELEAARFIDDNFSGFGPKQSRNLLQALRLSRLEVPIDSRITKWLNEFDFPLRLTATALGDRSYFEFVSEGFQRLAEACGIAPCVLDAAIFSSFDDGGWTDENVVR